MRIPAFAFGFVMAAASSLAAIDEARAQGGVWAALTNDQVVKVEQQFAEALSDYASGKDKDPQAKDLLTDLDRKNRAEVYKRARKPPGFQTDEERVKDSRRKLPGGEDPDTVEQGRKRRKDLRELLAELNAPKDPPLQKYSKEYADMLYKAFLKDPKKFSELAGEISAGEYTKVPETLESAGAALLTKSVSDFLDAYGYENSKAIWDGFTGGVEEYQDIGSSLLRGNWEKFRTGVKALATKKVKAAAEEAVKDTIGFAFGGGKLGAKAGGAYVKFIEAEVQFLQWSKEYLDRRLTQPCIDRYIDTYRSVGGPGGQEVAYQAFKDCSEERGKFIGFAKLEEYLVASGLDPDPIYRQMAEDIRVGNARNVADWLNTLVESRKKTVEAQWEKEFDAWSTKLAEMSSKFNQASGKFIKGLIEDELDAKELDELEWAALKALNDADRDYQLLKRAADGVTGACATFESARPDALDALNDAKADDELASTLDARARRFTGCTADATAIASLKRLLERAQKVNADFDRERKTAEAEVDAACKAAEAVATKTSQDEARRQLDDATARAAAAKKAAEAAEAEFRELGDLATRAVEVKLGGDQAARDELTEIADAAELLASSRALNERRLKEAQARMAAAVRTAQNLEGYAKDRAEAIKPILAPHRSGPSSDLILEVEAEIKQLLDDIAGCRLDITDAFTKGEGETPSLKAQQIPAITGKELLQSVAAAKAKCPDTPGEDPVATQRAIADLASGAETEASIVGLGKATYERCIAQAVTAFDNVRAAANAVLTMQAPIVDDVKNWAGTWTMSNGSGSLQIYDGEYISKGTFTWTPPPANVGPQGFSITMTAACQTGTKQGSTAVGTGISVEGFDLVTSPTDRTPPKREDLGAPANCKTGESLSKSVTVYVMPRASYSEGDVAKIKIGAFWGPGVTYRYVAGKPRP